MAFKEFQSLFLPSGIIATLLLSTYVFPKFACFEKARQTIGGEGPEEILWRWLGFAEIYQKNTFSTFQTYTDGFCLRKIVSSAPLSLVLLYFMKYAGETENVHVFICLPIIIH